MKYRWVLLVLFCIPTFLYADIGVEVQSSGLSEGSHLIVTSIQVGDGTAAAPSVDVGGGNDGFFKQSGVLKYSLNGTATNDVIFGASGIQSGNTNGPFMLNSEVATATNPVWAFIGDDDTGIGKAGADQLSLIAGGAEGARVDTDATAGNTRFMLYDIDNATLERVTVGAADSGGVGFKVLRIPN